MGRHTLLLELEYDGSRFHGVVRQPGYRTVGETLTDHLQAVFGSSPKALTFAARTDRGVSALQNFASCWYRDISPTDEQLSRLLAPLSDLRIKNARWVPRHVNARNSTLEKHYRYRIKPRCQGLDLEPQTPRDAWHVAPALDPSAMQRAARLLEGTHDYSAFRSVACGGKDPIKTLSSVSVTDVNGCIVIDVVGRAFLRKMVRILVGTLAEVGGGLRTPHSVQTLLSSPDRSHSGITAPACGLCLVSVKLTEF